MLFLPKFFKKLFLENSLNKEILVYYSPDAILEGPVCWKLQSYNFLLLTLQGFENL